MKLQAVGQQVYLKWLAHRSFFRGPGFYFRYMSAFFVHLPLVLCSPYFFRVPHH